MSDFAFMPPIPGSSSRRRSRSRPSEASLHTRSARPHCAGEPVERRPAPEELLQLVRSHAGDLARAERAPEPLLELERRGERLLHGDLLVEDEADEEGEWVARKEFVGLAVPREVEAVGGFDGHRRILRGVRRRIAREQEVECTLPARLGVDERAEPPTYLVPLTALPR